MDDECVEELGRPISSLKVAELRDELTKRALTKTGNKKELIDRLRMAIQRQATQQHQQQMCGTTAELTINQQVNPQQHQNVPQYMNAAVAMQQNQVAAAYQHQINQINQPQAAQIAAYTLNQQQYQKTVMQPLDLQQQLAAYPTQVQFVAADYQQQPQLQQQQQPLQLIIEPQQQYQASSVTNQPAIDMRVVQQTPQSTSPEQSIDLSSNTKQLARQEPPDELEPTASNDMTTVQDQQHDGINEPELANQNLASQQDVKSQDSIKSEQKNSSAMIEDKSEEQIRTTGATAQPSINTTEDLSEELILPVKSQDRQGVDQCSIESCKTTDPSTSTSTAQEGENTIQTSISLKRGPSETRSSLNSGNKEKRRKWSSKPTVTATEVGQDVVDGSQLNILTGGISSQKLEELITEKPTEVVKKTSKTDTAEFSEDHGKQETEADKIAEKSVKIKESDQEQTPQKDTSVIKANESQTGKEPDLPEQEQGSDPTRVLLIKNLVRPFTLLQLKEVLTKHGSMIEEKFWIDKVKSKCCVMYESLEVAQHTKESLDGQQWPSSNPKTLKIIYITEEILEKFQLSDSKVPEKAEVPENGNVEVVNKLISDRLGERLEDGETAVGADLKKRLGDKVSGDVSTKQSSVNREGGSSTPQKLDDLFKKTEAVPHLFWLPLTDDLADIRQKEKKEREALREANKKARRSPPRRRAHSRHRSPPARRSPPRHRSPVSRRPPINRRTPIKHRSPIGRRSPPRRRSPFHNRSPMLRRSRSPMLRRSRSRSPMLRRSRSRSPMLRRSRTRSPMLRRSRSRSPMLRRSRSRSPVLRRRSPTMLRRSPARRSPIRRSPLGRSPGLIRRSPMLRRSPGPIRRSPVQIGPRRSPLLVRRSPGPVRRSPPLIRRSPAPIRGSSPTLKRRSPRRNSPPRHMSPNRNMGNYGPPDHRRIR